MNNNSQEEKYPSGRISIIPFLFLVATLVCVIKIFGTDALSGASQVALFAAAGVAAAISIVWYKTPWKRLETSIVENLGSVTTSIIILLLIGAVAGSWMVSGVVPTMIYYGIKILSPEIFLVATCIICAGISITTGSSWSTIATVGVALVGIGTALGYDSGWTAGAIISGAYFGDKMSPLSDTTVLASSSSGTPLFSHIKYMVITTVPSISIALILFLLASLFHDSSEAMSSDFARELDDTFILSLWLLIVPVLTAVLIAKRVPAIVTLFCASVVAGIFALAFQPDLVKSIAAIPEYEHTSGLSFAEGFKGLFTTYYGHTAIETGNAALDSLISTRGMTGMLNTIYLILSAIIFGGVMSGSGMMQSLTNVLIRYIRGRIVLVSSTVVTGVFSNMITGDQYISILMTSNLYRKLYEKHGYENRLLSRTVEDSSTTTSVLVPWNSCGMTQATVLNVPTIEYLPYCFFNLISPVVSIIIAAFGFRIYRKTRK